MLTVRVPLCPESQVSLGLHRGGVPADLSRGPPSSWAKPSPSHPPEDVFPCKDCGIWYRSERNLQAHLLYYCASRQGAGAPAAASDEKPKDSYPNEHVCPFPQCRKSCPSASSLEIHMRSHSGETLPSPPWLCGHAHSLG